MAGIKWIIVKNKAYSWPSDWGIIKILAANKIASQNGAGSYVCNIQIPARINEI